MTNKIEIPRALAERLAAEGLGFETAKELRALLASHAEEPLGVVERQEPVAWIAPEEGFLTEMPSRAMEWVGAGFRVTPLYTSPPAPVAVALDERAEFEKWLRNQPHVVNLGFNRSTGKYVLQEDEDSWQAWQARACLDKVKEMNQ